MAFPAHQRTRPHRSAIQEMVEALDLEIAAAKERDRSGWMSIGVGTRQGGSPSRVLYRFHGVGRLQLRTGMDVRLQTRAATTGARVVATSGTSVTLGCLDDLGPRTGPARIRRDASWLLEALKGVLRSLVVVPRRAGLLLEPGHARTSVAPGTPGGDRAIDDLNPGQRAAVQRAVGSELSYLWGPPGTGKTRTLARLAEVLHHEGESVLLLAPTNRAVDHLLLKLAERLGDAPVLEEGRVLRIGSIESGELRRRFGHLVDLDRVACERPDGPSHPHLQEAIEDALSALAGRAGEETYRVEAVPEFQRTLTEDLRRLRRGATAHPGGRELNRGRLLARARIVATTLHRAYLPGQLDRSFDAVIVDEASAASFPVLFAGVALRARRRVVIGGDFRQLPPVVRSWERRAEVWLGRDAFQVGGLVEAVENGASPPTLSLLSRQYRMHPDICSFVSSYAYGGRLTTAGNRIRPPAVRTIFDEEPLVLIDTGPLAAGLLQPEGPGGRSSRRRSNPMHRLLVGRLLEELLGDADDDFPNPSVAVLSPYRDHVQSLREHFGSTYNAAIDTVHKAQGREYDVVILDLPEATGVEPSPFMRARDLTDAGARLLNVGVSRAREQLLVVADCAYYKDHDLEEAAVGRFFSQLTHMGSRISGGKVLESL